MKKILTALLCVSLLALAPACIYKKKEYDRNGNVVREKTVEVKREKNKNAKKPAKTARVKKTTTKKTVKNSDMDEEMMD